MSESKAKPAAAAAAATSPPSGAGAASSSSPAKPTDGKDDEEIKIPSNPEEVIDMETFQQIRDMDEDDDEDEPNAFSKGIVFGYFEQAEATLKQMDDALAEKDLPNLSSLGHFLKGSSAALGVIKVQHACELIQHYGNKRDETASKDLSPEDALQRIAKLLKECRKEYRIAKACLQQMYE